MRWLTDEIHDERGASAIMVGILMIPILGFLALALDVGALYVERAQLQNGADAAALAIARECAAGDCGDTTATASAFADDNANDGAANVLTPTFPTATSVTVTSTTLQADGTTTIDHPFARFIGVDSTTVAARATAEWGFPGEGPTVLPLAISYCEFNPALDGTLQLIRYDQNLTCSGRDGHPIPGGFGWLDRIDGECGAYVDVDSATIESEPGNSYPGVCDATLLDLEGKTILVPIFDDADVTHGPAASYHIHAFAAFRITGWKFSGGPAVTNLDPAAPDCSGNCRGIQGYFERWVSPEEAGFEIGGPDLGASIVHLID